MALFGRVRKAGKKLFNVLGGAAERALIQSARPIESEYERVKRQREEWEAEYAKARAAFMVPTPGVVSGDLDRLIERSRQESERIRRELKEAWRREQAELLAREKQARQQITEEEDLTILKDFLSGEVISTPWSTNVNFIAYEMQEDMRDVLVVGYLGMGPDSTNADYGLRVYKYWPFTQDEAIKFFDAAMVSPGGAVWDELRVRGTVFGHQKEYTFMESWRGVKPRAVEPGYMADPMDQVRHMQIPKSGRWPDGEKIMPWY